ncbi:RNA-dependent RNA polymerase [Primus virus]|uniref:Replicase n=1 Tax=Primus virus TaxID=2722918 RepID=A0A6H0C864_9RHAB|nr:RNA-dependent RNA polymerase [Primus virus]
MDDDHQAQVEEEAPLPTHCNSPLKYSNARAALLRPATRQYIAKNNPARQEWKIITDMLPVERIQGFDSAYHQNEILRNLTIKMHRVDERGWHLQEKVAKDMWTLNVRALEEMGPTGLPSHMPDLLNHERNLLYRWYSLRSFFEEGVLISGGAPPTEAKYWTKIPGTLMWESAQAEFHFVVGKRLFFILSPRGVSLLSRDHLVVLSDVIAQRYILHQSNILDLKLGKTTFRSGFLEKLFRNGDEILEKGGNEAYKVIYGLEAACTSRLVGDIKLGSPSGLSYLEKVTADGREKAVATGTELLWEEREALIQDVSSDPFLLSQCFGLYRLWGHPTLEPLLGASALKAIATNVRITSATHAEAISNKFKEEFVTRYYAQKQAWPEIDVSELSERNVIRVAYQNLAPVPTDHKNYRRGHWSLVSFKKCFPVDPKFELLEVLSDKALSLDTFSLITHIEAGLGPGSSLERALLLNWLRASVSEPESFLKWIDEKGFPFPEKSVGLKEKEREGKLDARMFGLMTFCKRMYIVLTEALIAEHILPLFPEITMTDDELSLDKKRLAFTRKRKDQFQLFTSLDFSKWNSNMRKEETLPVFRSFDQLFGFKALFQRTHEMFEDSFMYLLNGSYTPLVQNRRLIPVEGSWYGHLGGIEGLRQKGWTVWTIILILLCAEGNLMKLKLMGQGDNQILQMLFSSGMSEEQCMRDYYSFMDKLQKMLSVIGPPLKLEETWTSKDLFIYGKYFIYQGVALESSYKRICRMFKMSNEDFPTIESAVSSMTANVSAALSCSASIGSEYFIYLSELVGLFQLYLTVTYLHKEAPIDQLERDGQIRIPGSPAFDVPAVLSDSLMVDEAFYKKLLLFPRCLGGFPIMSLPQLLVRGFPDDLSMAISFLKIVYKMSTPPIKRFIKAILSPKFNANGSFTLLLENPTSLNLMVPPSPGEARRSSILQFLQDSSSVKNQFFLAFLKVLASDEEASLVEFLKTCRPCNPVVLSAVYDATAIARARKVVGKLQKTRTISKLAISEGQVDLFTIIRESEINHLRSVLYHISFPDPGPILWTSSCCSLDHAKQLRNTGWGVEIVGVDCAPPLEIIKIEENKPHSLCDPLCELDKGYISVQLPPSMTPDSLSDPGVYGPFAPYRGAATKQKIMGFGSAIASYSSPLIAKAMRLGNLIGWATQADSYFATVIENVIRTVTDIPLSELLPYDPDAGGSVHHRYEDDRIEKGGSVCVLPNFGTKMMFITNYLIAYSKGSKNVNFMFQPVMAMASCMLGTHMRHVKNKVFYPFHIHIKKSCCIQPVNEDMIEGDKVPVCLVSRPNNPFLFVPRDKAIPPTLRTHVFPAGCSAAETPEERTVRLTCLVGYRIFQILEVPNWNRKIFSTTKPGIVINWAFKTPLIKALEITCLLLLAFFSNQLHEKSASDYIQMVLERVARTSVESWKGLSNLIHCPNFHHELASQPYGTVLIGNPEMSDTILSLNIRKTVMAILGYWGACKPNEHPLQHVQIRAPTSCGVITHPAMLLLVKRWILNQMQRNPIQVRHAIVATLNKSILKRETGYESATALSLIKASESLIVPETPDSLCKKAPDLCAPEETISVPPLERAHTIVGTFYRRYRIQAVLTMGEQEIKPKNRSYEGHKFKIAASPTTGPYKGISLMLEAAMIHPSRVLCCGDGAGGFTLAALLMLPNAEVFYNTLITSSDPIQQAPPIPYLPALAGHPTLETRLKGLDLTNDNVSDLMSPDFADMFRVKFSSRLDVIVCDAECKDYLLGTHAIELAHKITLLGNATSANMIIFKTYAMSLTVLAAQVSCFLASYDAVEVTRCYFSNPENTEVYLIVSGLKKMESLQISENEVSGLVISNLMIASLWPRIQKIPPAKWEEFYLDYSLAISPDWERSLYPRLRSELPFLTVFQHNPYPKSCIDWAHQTCMRVRGSKSLKRAVITTSWFTRIVLGRIMIQFLAAYAMIHESNWKQVMEKWESFKLVWYGTRRDRWSLFLTISELPPDTLQFCRVWRINDYLAIHTKKRLNQLIGMQAHMGIQVTGDILHPEGTLPRDYQYFPTDKAVRRFLNRQQEIWENN